MHNNFPNINGGSSLAWHSGVGVFQTRPSVVQILMQFTNLPDINLYCLTVTVQTSGGVDINIPMDHRPPNVCLKHSGVLGEQFHLFLLTIQFPRRHTRPPTLII